MRISTGMSPTTSVCAASMPVSQSVRSTGSGWGLVCSTLSAPSTYEMQSRSPIASIKACSDPVPRDEAMVSTTPRSRSCRSVDRTWGKGAGTSDSLLRKKISRYVSTKRSARSAGPSG